jgi:phosphatidylglycerol:prolipoprotein diacylglycerol transferase
MNPIAFRIGALSIHWYGILVALGFLSAVAMMQWNRRHADMTADQVADMTFFTLLGGILGARAWYVIEFWGEYRDHPLDIIMIQKGGLVYYGGFLLALVAIFWFCRRRGLSLVRVCDLGAVGLAVGHAVGRLGCFMQGCCHGRAASGWLAFQYPRVGYVVDADGHLLNPLLGQPVYPVQLLESAGNLLLAVGLYFALRRLRPGRTAALYMISYGTLRFCLEFLRGDHRDRLFGIFTPAQSLGLVLVPVGVAIWLILRYCDRKAMGAPTHS